MLAQESLDSAIVETLPVISGCEIYEQDNEKNKACFEKEIIRHIVRNFHYPEKARKNGIQGKVYVFFIIEKDGSVDEVKVARSATKNYSWLSWKKKRYARSCLGRR